MKFHPPKIYPITDTRISGLSHAEQVELLIAGGATLIQLREKHASPRDFYASAIAAVDVGKGHGVSIIINDRVDIALAARAAGVHLGQDDMPPAAARSVLGDEAIIGFSTHSLEQAQAAMGLPIDYIAIGPIFETKTKEQAHLNIGIGGLRSVRDAVGDTPLIAIGGIDESMLAAVFEAGADSAAMIRALISNSAKIGYRLRQFIHLSSNLQ